MREYQRRRRQQETDEQRRCTLEEFFNNQRVRLSQDTKEKWKARL